MVVVVTGDKDGRGMRKGMELLGESPAIAD
jgi:hypothetical protein